MSLPAGCGQWQLAPGSAPFSVHCLSMTRPRMKTIICRMLAAAKPTGSAVVDDQTESESDDEILALNDSLVSEDAHDSILENILVWNDEAFHILKLHIRSTAVGHLGFVQLRSTSVTNQLKAIQKISAFSQNRI